MLEEVIDVKRNKQSCLGDLAQQEPGHFTEQCSQIQTSETDSQTHLFTLEMEIIGGAP